MTLFRDQFRVESARHPSWDYSLPGSYFITICTHRRECLFGTIRDQQLQSSFAGEAAQQVWTEIPKHFANVETDAFVVMPNHIHGILVIFSTDRVQRSRSIKPKLGDIAGSYKSSVSRLCRPEIPTFAWQTRFYDRIIRSPKMLSAIRQYVADNPANWREDEFFVE